MATTYDAIIIGARCAGASTAMLLARRGYRVLLLDRATFPSDTISTHVVHPRGVAALARWGLLDRLVATGCPPIHTYSFDFGPFTLSGSPGTPMMPVAYCPRRTVLDELLVEAAAEAGAEVREGFAVDAIRFGDEGQVVGIVGRTNRETRVGERAQVVVGADGRQSIVARAVSPQQYHDKPPLLAAYYSYWSGLPMHGRFETYIRPDRGAAAVETHDGLTIVIVGWPYSEFEANKRDVERHFLQVFDVTPLAARLRRARRETPFAGAAVPNFFRKPYGRGWALVGDAGYNRDPITAQGITDAFRHAERLAVALDEGFSGARCLAVALSDYQRDRDAQVLSMYEFTCQLATLAPPPPEMQQLFSAIEGNQAAMNAFVQMNAGTISPAAFFAPEHIASMTAAAQAVG